MSSSRFDKLICVIILSREDEEKYKEDDKTISADGGSERGGDFDPSSKADLVDSTTKF